jgi:hypothetical protein
MKKIPMTTRMMTITITNANQSEISLLIPLTSLELKGGAGFKTLPHLLSEKIQFCPHHVPAAEVPPPEVFVGLQPAFIEVCVLMSI